MNRPDRRNALNPEMTRGLVEAARRGAEDHEVRAVLLKGAGGTFCVGGDVKSMAEGRAPLPFEAKKANLRRGMEVSRILHEMPKPVVAQIDGPAAGAGLSIALSCDLLVAGAQATPPITRRPRRPLSRSANPRSWVIEMAPYIRLRQICLVAPQLEPVISDISAIMGLNVCYRDGNVAKYGLENALLPVDTILLEVVAPFQPGTAAGRFLEKTGGRGGYMAIFFCDDPHGRGKHAQKIGVRIPHVIRHS